MAAWHEPPARPSLPRLAVAIALCVYLGAMLVLVAWILWKVVHPLPHIFP